MNEKIWWFGFDCNHTRDNNPFLEKQIIQFSPYFPRGEYRTFEYVQKEVENLARQLNGIEPTAESSIS